MGAAAILQGIGGLISANAARNEGIIAEKTAESQSLTEGYNSSQRQLQRIKAFRKQAATNIAKAGSSGTTYSGSVAAVNRHSAGNLKYANFQDVFSTNNKRSQITSAGKTNKQAAKVRGFSSLINTAGTIAGSVG